MQPINTNALRHISGGSLPLSSLLIAKTVVTIKDGYHAFKAAMASISGRG